MNTLLLGLLDLHVDNVPHFLVMVAVQVDVVVSGTIYSVVMGTGTWTIISTCCWIKRSLQGLFVVTTSKPTNTENSHGSP